MNINKRLDTLEAKTAQANGLPKILVSWPDPSDPGYMLIGPERKRMTLAAWAALEAQYKISVVRVGVDLANL